MICTKCGAWVRQGQSRCDYCGEPGAQTVPEGEAAGSRQPRVAPPLGAAETVIGRQASAWSRYWARSLDVAVTLAVVIVLAAVFAPRPFDLLNARLNGHLADQVMAVILLPFAMVLDALIYALCGNTPAKWLCGIRATDLAGHKLGARAYLLRNLHVCVRGLGLGIALVALLTCIHNYQRVSAGLLTSWDQKLETRVLRLRGGTWRITLTASIYLLLTLGCAALTLYLGLLPHESELEMVAAQLNKDTPRSIDAQSRLEHVTVVSGRTLEFDYTLVNVTGSDSDATSVTARLAKMRAELARAFCTEMPAITGLESMRYRYTGRDQQVLGTIEVSQQECAGGR